MPRRHLEEDDGDEEEMKVNGFLPLYSLFCATVAATSAIVSPLDWFGDYASQPPVKRV